MTTKHDEGELKRKFWKALDDSPHLFLQLDGDPLGAVPMSAQLDKDADSAIWFFTTRDHHFAGGGPATATFSAKGHDLFARFSGTLNEETSRERLDREWSNYAEAWFPQGKDDPNLLMLRMDLGPAQIWHSDVGFLTGAKMMLGMDIRGKVGESLETTL